ncbi:hypothetical protein I2W78_02955 [Streptomyces spinoverrucosus]|uniref:hypothetical protein n=1 Tax=Streptomyces spinoverrucosus TaxID=284043 RepID=UPI0018C443AC|nr:hypothetical protein [Streptomyces spinoverrucosus]MBG0850841.1 hypothetical protein [Streptomyces spinoverrucosus]
MSDTTPPARPRRTLDVGGLSRTVLFFALAVSALLVGVAALLIGISWMDLVDNARQSW